MADFNIGDRVEVVANRAGFLSYVGHRGIVQDVYQEDGYVLVALDGEPDHLIYEFDTEEEVRKID